MQVLVALARRRGQVVSRDQLIETCWAGRVVGEDAINRCIAKVRRLGRNPRRILGRNDRPCRAPTDGAGGRAAGNSRAERRSRFQSQPGAATPVGSAALAVIVVQSWR